MGEDMDVFTMDNTDMPKIDHEDTREELEPHFSPAVRGRGSGKKGGRGVLFLLSLVIPQALLRRHFRCVREHALSDSMQCLDLSRASI